MKTFRGYIPDSELPYRRGSKVRLPAGTPTRTHKGGKVLTRAQTVTINHWLNGSEIQVGVYWHTRDAVDFGYPTNNDVHTVEELYGTTTLADLWPLMHMETDGEKTWLYLPISSPQLRWAGTGGYWKAVDFEHVPAPNPESTR